MIVYALYIKSLKPELDQVHTLDKMIKTRFTQYIHLHVLLRALWKKE